MSHLPETIECLTKTSSSSLSASPSSCITPRSTSVTLSPEQSPSRSTEFQSLINPSTPSITEALIPESEKLASDCFTFLYDAANTFSNADLIQTVADTIQDLETLMKKVNDSRLFHHLTAAINSPENSLKERENAAKSRCKVSKIHDMKELTLGLKSPLELAKKSLDSAEEAKTDDNAAVENLKHAIQMYYNAHCYEETFIAAPKADPLRSLDHLIMSSLPELEMLAGNTNKPFKVTFSETAKTVIFNTAAKALLLKSILFNLCTNAFKYGAGNVCLDISFDDETKQIEFSVSDEGAPVSDEITKQIFAESSTPDVIDITSPTPSERTDGGWGIGVQTAFLNAQMQLNITEKRQETTGRGKAFVFKVSSASITTDILKSQLIKCTPPTIETEDSPYILIIAAEDGQTNQKMIRRSLQALKPVKDLPHTGYIIMLCGDGASALDILNMPRLYGKKIIYRVLSTDIDMPVLSGSELISKIANSDALKGTTSIIVHAAQDTTEDNNKHCELSETPLIKINGIGSLKTTITSEIVKATSISRISNTSREDTHGAGAGAAEILPAKTSGAHSPVPLGMATPPDISKPTASVASVISSRTPPRPQIQAQVQVVA